jgi:hypothetical protein
MRESPIIVDWRWHDEYGDTQPPGEWIDQVGWGLEQIRRSSSKGSDVE